MPPAQGGSNRDPLRAIRCRCGHYPVSHMRVVPIGTPGSGGYRLDPGGPCAVCGPEVCSRLQPLPPGESPP